VIGFGCGPTRRSRPQRGIGTPKPRINAPAAIALTYFAINLHQHDRWLDAGFVLQRCPLAVHASIRSCTVTRDHRRSTSPAMVIARLRFAPPSCRRPGCDGTRGPLALVSGTFYY